ncbi:MAG: UPF0280 family protein [Rhodobacterales bacterium]|nr:UPF0280 family protein [Rhodobacterales bacterium]
MARALNAAFDSGQPRRGQPRRRARLQDPDLPLAVPVDRQGPVSGRDVSGRQMYPEGAIAALLPEGRLHLQHGPIDIVAKAFGARDAVRAGHARAAARFSTVLKELVAELSALRSDGDGVGGPVARRMVAAVTPFHPAFLTPMAAVAGAVAEEVLAALAVPGLTRAYVNNGGDIALWLAPGEHLTCALAATGGLDRVTVRSADPVRGIATSGWRGRSFSLGIADAVTVLARTAAMADAAATMIANAVNLDHPGIRRRPAHDLQSDSDLGSRLVTCAVPLLSPPDRALALDCGLAAAEGYRTRGLIEGAALFLQGDARATGMPALEVMLG